MIDFRDDPFYRNPYEQDNDDICVHEERPGNCRMCDYDFEVKEIDNE